jgi:hypothetical protein
MAWVGVGALVALAVLAGAPAFAANKLSSASCGRFGSRTTR